ncbi:MAG: hypothetical protein AWM53_01607 [Candidatus Dichloromethanomonas elyunquensis]|nr:MAG: hypothetical protein AWM53_01607 [Candidatus Dichloromethanomonas elyunquensis]
MDGHEYVYRMKPLIIPGLGYLILYPVLLGIIGYVFLLPLIYTRIFSGIYLVSAAFILGIWLTAKSKRIIVDDHMIVFRSLAGKQVIEPKDIRRASFFWTKRNEEIVQLKAGKKTFYLSNFYFPFNELMTDIEDFILNNNIRNNLSSYYGMNE